MENKNYLSALTKLARAFYQGGFTPEDLGYATKFLDPRDYFDLEVYTGRRTYRVPVDYVLKPDNSSQFDSSIWEGLSPEECRKMAKGLFPFKDDNRSIGKQAEEIYVTDQNYSLAPSLDFWKRVRLVQNKIDEVFSELEWPKISSRLLHAQNNKIVILYSSNQILVKDAGRDDRAYVRY